MSLANIEDYTNNIQGHTDQLLTSTNAIVARADTTFDGIDVMVGKLNPFIDALGGIEDRILRIEMLLFTALIVGLAIMIVLFIYWIRYHLWPKLTSSRVEKIDKSKFPYEI